MGEILQFTQWDGDGGRDGDRDGDGGPYETPRVYFVVSFRFRVVVFWGVLAATYSLSVHGNGGRVLPSSIGKVGKGGEGFGRLSFWGSHLVRFH